MKTNDKNSDKVILKEGTECAPKKSNSDLQTDFPMSEKDEVKRAEQNTNKQPNKDR